MTRSIGAGGSSEVVFDGNAEVNPWKNIGTFPIAFREGVAVEYNGEGYVSSGSDTNGFYKYDPSDGSTTQLSSNLQSRNNYGGDVFGDEIFVFGGVSSTGDVQAEVFDIVGGSWTEITGGPSLLGGGTRAVKLNTQIAVIGSNGGTDGTRTDTYDPANDSWDTNIPNAPVDVSNSSVAKVPGGTADTAYVMTTAGDLYTFDLLSGWSDLGISIPPGESMAVYDGSDIWFIGGVETGTFSTSSSVTKFDPDTQEKTDAPDLPTGLTNAASAILGGEIHLFGGGLGESSDSIRKYDSAGRGTIATGEGVLYALGSTDSGAELVNLDTGVRGNAVFGRSGDDITLSKNGNAEVYKL